MHARMNWLPIDAEWRRRMERILAESTFSADSPSEQSRPEVFWKDWIQLTKLDLDFLACAKLDRTVQKFAANDPPPAGFLQPVRLALLGSSTLKHLIPGIRVAGLRRGLWIEVHEGDYGLYFQELLDPASSLYSFRPQIVALALDAAHLLEIAEGDPDNAINRMRACWHLAKDKLSATVIQQTALPVIPDLFGNNEFRMVDSPQAILQQINRRVEPAADAAGVHLLAIDKYAAIEGIPTWHDPALWLRTRQEVHPQVSTLYGEYLVRLVAAQRGRSAKCVVLDLDNTLWGGVIGDDGLDGIVLGHGSPAGEAFLALQQYALQLRSRGILLAVCSKNEEANALLPFTKHPDMLLKRADIACFVANWQDKATNLRSIAHTLNIGIDSLVFVDDNPFERNLVRAELPEVAVPEMPEDPALYVATLAAAGYFEGLNLTEEDRARAEQYRANAEREGLRQSSTDIDSYLRGMEMKLFARPFDAGSLNRIVQLLNKTNQFNLTTRRYTDAEVGALMVDPRVRTWQLRLTDRFGDNGIIGLMIALINQEGDLEIDTWLMSCRVLGRQVEEASLNLIVEAAHSLGAKSIFGEYKPTAKNAMVRDLYSRLGFELIETDDLGNTCWQLDVAAYQPRDTHILVQETLHATL